jgi:hypothetical protein
MKRFTLAATVGAVLSLVTCWAETSHAQVRRYTPATPTISPYLNLTRFNGGGLPNYYSLVRPQVQQQAFDQQQAAQQQYQGQRIATLQDEVQSGLTPTGKAAGFMNFGTRHTFGDTTGRFPQPGQIRRR